MKRCNSPGCRRRSALTLLLAALTLLATTGFDLRREQTYSGRSMGTSYHITVVSWSLFRSNQRLHERIQRRLQEVNRIFSTFDPESEISRFNALQQAGAPFAVSTDFIALMQVASQVHRISGGAWDGTVWPLVRLWGFGDLERPPQVPEAHQIQQALDQVGFDAITINEDLTLTKQRAPLSLDLASIAKGYGVDQVAGLLRKRGYQDFLVEIGGEVAAAGRRADGKPWRVGINTPSPEGAPDSVYRVVELSDKSLATSGNYRNFFEIDGRRYSHILDPRSGFPVDNDVLSVSVSAPTCTLADALATAVMVMGADSGLELLEQMEQVEGLIVVLQADGSLADRTTAGFRALAPGG